jgi:hypothetical protein
LDIASAISQAWNAALISSHGWLLLVAISAQMPDFQEAPFKEPT